MFRPKIIGFACNWSLPPEIAGLTEARIPGYPRIRIVRVMCAGRIDPVIVLETFAKGADGVAIIGCYPPDCHFVEGNVQAEHVEKALKKLLALTGLEPERMKLFWYSPHERRSFGHSVREFYEEIKKIGPSPLSIEEIDSRIAVSVLAATKVASDFRLRVLLGREKELAEGINVYGEKLSQAEFDKKLDDIVEAEFVRQKIHVLTTNVPLSVKSLSTTMAIKPSMVLKHLVNMRRKNLIALDHLEGRTPFYKALEAE